jgi:hypothetical protein
MWRACKLIVQRQCVVLSELHAGSAKSAVLYSTTSGRKPKAYRALLPKPLKTARQKPKPKVEASSTPEKPFQLPPLAVNMGVPLQAAFDESVLSLAKKATTARDHYVLKFLSTNSTANIGGMIK